jgi:hypothetical protein
MKNMKLHRLIIVTIFYIESYSATCQTTDNFYLIQGVFKYNSQLISKKDFKAMIVFKVLSNDKSERTGFNTGVIDGSIGRLDYGPFRIVRHVGDSIISLAIDSKNYEDMIFVNTQVDCNLFSKSGKLENGNPSGRIITEVLDKSTYARNKIYEDALNIANTNPTKAIEYLKIIDSTNIDKTEKQLYNTQMALAKIYYNLNMHKTQSLTYDSIIHSINIDALTFLTQKKFWIENYDSKLLTINIDTVKGKNERIQFNNNFGNLVFTNSEILENGWKPFVVKIKNSEYGKLKLASLNADSFDSPEKILEQKRIISESFDRKEILLKN